MIKALAFAGALIVFVIVNHSLIHLDKKILL